MQTIRRICKHHGLARFYKNGRCAECSAAYSARTYVRRPRKLRKDATRATRSPSTNDLYWAAGFLEGEGCFSFTGTQQRVRANQVNRDPLARLQEIFGGTTTINRRPKYDNHGKHRPIACWAVTGTQARGVMLTLYSLLSVQRQAQVRYALGEVRRGATLSKQETV